MKKEKRYFCDWLKENLNVVVDNIAGCYSVTFLACLCIMFKLYAYEPEEIIIAEIGQYVIEAMGFVMISSVMALGIVGCILFAIYLTYIISRHNKNKAKS